VGRRIMAWMLNHLEPESDAEVPTRLQFKGLTFPYRDVSEYASGLPDDTP
jgi:hypothetical protein